MDLLNLILNSQIVKNTCFLCFKHHHSVASCYNIIEIHDEYVESNVTVSFILKDLFPNHEFLLSQACQDCTDLLIKIFILLRKSYMRNELISLITDEMSNRIHENVFHNDTIFNIKIKLPKYEDLFKKSIGTSEEKLLDCKNCNTKFKFEKMLLHHSKCSHDNISKSTICDVCGKICKKSSALKAHVKNHKEKQCPYCSKTLKLNSHFNIHLKKHEISLHRQQKKKYYSCGECNYRSINKISLEAHLNKVRLNIRPYKCTLCQKAFFKKSNLTEHLRIHNSDKNNICEICGDVFVNKKTLAEHLRLHTGSKPFRCATCGATFVNSGRRTEHVRRKHGEKKESCDVCGKRFGLKKDLKAHIKVVHNS